MHASPQRAHYSDQVAVHFCLFRMRWISLVRGEFDTWGASIILGRGDPQCLKHIFNQLAGLPKGLVSRSAAARNNQLGAEAFGIGLR
jgi:hypothetical protein